MDSKIIEMLLQKLINRADEVDGEEALGAEDDEEHIEPDEDDEDDDTLSIVKLFK
jgi:hypothetical protein